MRLLYVQHDQSDLCLFKTENGDTTYTIVNAYEMLGKTVFRFAGIEIKDITSEVLDWMRQSDIHFTSRLTDDIRRWYTSDKFPSGKHKSYITLISEFVANYDLYKLTMI